MGHWDFEVKKKLSVVVIFEFFCRSGSKKEGIGICRTEVSLLGEVINSRDLISPFSCSIDNR